MRTVKEDFQSVVIFTKIMQNKKYFYIDRVPKKVCNGNSKNI